MPTTLGPRPRRAPGALAALVVALSVALTGCLSGTAPEKETAPGAPQEAQRVWSVPSTHIAPVDTTTGRFWTSTPLWSDGAWEDEDTRMFSTGLAIHDSWTGAEVPSPVDDFVCTQTRLDPGDEVTVLLLATRGREHTRTGAWRLASEWASSWVAPNCTELVAVRLSTGDVVWRRTLDQVDGVMRRSLDMHEDALHISTYDLPTRCFGLRDGATVPCGPSRPTAMRDKHGDPLDETVELPEVLATDRGVTVILIRHRGAPFVVHAFDTASGEWLWDAALETDPTPERGWDRTSTYAFGDEGLLRFTYEGEDLSVLVVSRVDERTGETLGEVGRIEDVVFRGQSGATTIVGGLPRGKFVPPLKGYRFDGCGRACSGV